MKDFSASTVITMFFLVMCLGRECWTQVDLTLVPREQGSDVVLAVVAKIEDSEVFPTDNRLLRRMAYVESKDGTDSDTYRPLDRYYGGIWQVDLAAFQRTQNTKSFPALEELHSEIAQKIYDGDEPIEWTTVEWTALEKPMYSGLAARLFLATIDDDIPAASNVSGQADYWNGHYKKGEGDVEAFTADVIAILDIEVCEVFFDLIFVLDSSGSINEDNYNQVLGFVHNFVSQLAIGPDANQVGVIIFGNQEEIVFNLSTYSNKSNLLQAIDAVPYLSEYTNTGDALRTMGDVGFSSEAGARVNDNTIFRIAIVLTDGQANRGERLESVTAHVHGIDPPILVYAIGVGTGYNITELKLIASEPGFIDLLQSFDDTLFQQSQEERTYEICFKASVRAEVEEVVRGGLDQGQQVRYQLSIPEEGVTILLCVNNGRIVLYASTTIPNPSEAYYDFKLDCIDCNACKFFVDPSNFVPEVTTPRGRRKRADDNSTMTVFTNLTLYISMEGVESNNTFEIQSDIGDTTTPVQATDDDDFPWILIGAIAGGDVVVILVVFLCVCLCICRLSRNPKTPDVAEE